MSYSYTLNKITLTDAGIALLQRAIAGEELAFSSVALGDGVPTSEFSYTQLVSEKLRVSVRKVTSYSSKTIINTFISNASVLTSFDVHEIGIYAIDPTTNSNVLYAYGYFNPKTDTIPASSVSVLEEIYEIEVYTSNASNITVTIDTSLVYALQEDLEDLEDELDDAKEDIEDIQGLLSGFASQTDLENVETDVEALEGDIENIQQTYSLITNTGSIITATYDSSTHNVSLSLKNANNTVLSTASFTIPISDTLTNCSYSNGVLTFTYKNGTTKQVNISSIISGLVPNTRTIAGIDLQDNITKSELLAALGINAGCPSGMIAMWSGTVATIPTGWYLCDGNNGTPDLRDRFVVGAGSNYSVGGTGGEATHTLTVNEMPEHNHKIHYYTGSGSRATALSVGGSSFVNDMVEPVEDCRGSNDEEVIQSTGGGQAHNNLPPYYALAFIMKS